MIGLITDRTQANVDRRKELSAKGWNNMTPAERAEWSGDPLLADGGVNLLPKSENFAAGTTVRYQEDSIWVTSQWDGTYIYAVLVIGPAANYAGKTMTLSLGSYFSSGGTPNILLYWHDANGSEYAGGGLSDAGSITFTLTENTAGRESLALYLYATTDTAITAGTYIIYKKLMLEMGETAHEYVPYYAVLPTPATKGAYNYSDLNRVEAAIAELADMGSFTLQTKTNWSAWDLPKQADMNRILTNIAMLRKAFPLPPDVPATPTSMENLTFTTANNIEKILGKMAEVTDKSFRSGELYAGEI